MTHSTIRIGILFLATVSQASVFKQYIRDSYLDDHKCVNSSMSFKLTNVSMLICADSGRRHACPSLMFKEDGGVCYGCSALFPLTATNYTFTNLVPENETNHYYDRGFELMFRFANDSMKTDEGRIEMFYKGVWGTVCDDKWTDGDPSNNVKVLCSSLGFFGGGQVLSTRTYRKPIEEQSPYWLDDVQCKGTEVNIAECEHPGFGVNDCGPGEDLNLRCIE